MTFEAKPLFKQLFMTGNLILPFQSLQSPEIEQELQSVLHYPHFTTENISHQTWQSFTATTVFFGSLLN